MGPCQHQPARGLRGLSLPPRGWIGAPSLSFARKWPATFRLSACLVLLIPPGLGSFFHLPVLSKSKLPLLPNARPMAGSHCLPPERSTCQEAALPAPNNSPRDPPAFLHLVLGSSQVSGPDPATPRNPLGPACLKPSEAYLCGWRPGTHVFVMLPR